MKKTCEIGQNVHHFPHLGHLYNGGEGGGILGFSPLPHKNLGFTPFPNLISAYAPEEDTAGLILKLSSCWWQFHFYFILFSIQILNLES